MYRSLLARRTNDVPRRLVRVSICFSSRRNVIFDTHLGRKVGISTAVIYSSPFFLIQISICSTETFFFLEQVSTFSFFFLTSRNELVRIVVSIWLESNSSTFGARYNSHRGSVSGTFFRPRRLCSKSDLARDLLTSSYEMRPAGSFARLTARISRSDSSLRTIDRSAGSPADTGAAIKIRCCFRRRRRG